MEELKRSLAVDGVRAVEVFDLGAIDEAYEKCTPGPFSKVFRGFWVRE